MKLEDINTEVLTEVVEWYREIASFAGKFITIKNETTGEKESFSIQAIRTELQKRGTERTEAEEKINKALLQWEADRTFDDI